MKFLFSIKGLKAFSIAALAGVCTVPVWAANNPASSDAVVSKVEVEPVERLGAEALETLVAPVALYPDDLLAVVLPASTYPLQVVLAARFLEAGSDNADGDAVEPSEEWDDAVVALLNYPEVVALMDGNLDWTRRLGEAVLVQEEDVIAAIGAFREQAKDAGNLKSDGKQEVAVNDAGAIEIKPAVPDEIYVPYYEPAEVVVRQPARVYHYHPRPYPVYYYPYHQGYDFTYGPFWGVTSAFSIGWHTRNLHLHHYGFQDHPYYSYRYYDPFYHRRPHLVLNIYDRDRRHRHRHRSERHHRGNDWRSERSKRNRWQWAERGERRRGKSHRGDRQRWAGRDDLPRGEDRRNNQRQRRTQQGEAESVAHRLAKGAAPVIHRPIRVSPLGEARPRPSPNRPNASGATADTAVVDRAPAGATPATHRPTRVRPLGEAPRRSNPNRAGASGAAPASAASADPSPAQRIERQRTPGWRTERRNDNIRRSRSQSAVAARPAHRPGRVQPLSQAQRQARPTRPAAAQSQRLANPPQQARQVQRSERLLRERTARQAPARPQPSRSAEVSRGTRINRAPPPRAQRRHADKRQLHQPTRRQAIGEARARPNLNPGALPRMQRSAPATRQAAPQAHSEPRINRQASPRVDRAAKPVRPAPQRPVRTRSGSSNNDFSSRRQPH